MLDYVDSPTFEEFISWLGMLDPFHQDKYRSHIKAWQFQLLFRILYGCGLRISEGLNLKTNDIDLVQSTILVSDSESGSIQKTTILPQDIQKLRKYIENLSTDSKLFPISKSIAWQYAKWGGQLAGLNVTFIHGNRKIEGIWTDIFRRSCAKRMIDLGAAPKLIKIKLRIPFDSTDSESDLRELVTWEHKMFAISNLK